MKKRVVIELDIDTERSGDSQAQIISAAPGDCFIRAHVVVRASPSMLAPPHPLVVTAHELGHLLGRIFLTPAAAMEPRRPRNEQLQVYQECKAASLTFKQAVLNSEEDAWNIAETIVDHLQEVRSEAMSTYRLGIGPKQEQDWERDMERQREHELEYQRIAESLPPDILKEVDAALKEANGDPEPTV